MQTVVGLFIVLVIILSMGLQFSNKEGFKIQAKLKTKVKPQPQKSVEKFTSMAHMNMFDGMPAHY
jgi:hypothetical protein